MLLRNLSKVYVSRATEHNDHGEYTRSWSFVSVAYLNLQQDINELDRNSAGETNYDIQKARTDNRYDIRNGDGISFVNIKNKENIVPEYRVLDQSKIGITTLYRLEKYNG